MIRIALAAASPLVRAGLADGLGALAGFELTLAAGSLGELREAGFAAAGSFGSGTDCAPMPSQARATRPCASSASTTRVTVDVGTTMP